MIQSLPITAVGPQGAKSRSDDVIVEAPLLIRLGHTKYDNGGAQLSWHDLVVTMRTPGHDAELAIGYLVAEGIIEHPSQVTDVTVGPYQDPTSQDGGASVEQDQPMSWPGVEPMVASVTLEPSTQISEACLTRRTLASASCGICGKTALSDLLKRTAFPVAEPAKFPLTLSGLKAVGSQTRRHQPLFQRSGGVHSCGLFSAKGDFVAMFEDVGRHNAFDKLVGHLCRADKLPAKDHIAWLSGRVSFEMTQKAIMAGIGTIVAVGAPSQLAVHLARQAHIRLVGFADGARFNIY